MPQSRSKSSTRTENAAEKGNMRPNDEKSAVQPLLGRRRFLFGAAGLAVVSTGGYLWWRRQAPDHDHPRLGVAEAFAKAQAGEIYLIDIRTPREWRASGVPVGSHQIDMRRDDFLTALNEVTGGSQTAAIALICARGVRSARVTLALAEAGYTNVIDVPEGMLGSAAGPGWLRSNLPVARWEGQA